MFRVWVFDSQTTPGTTDSGSGDNSRYVLLFSAVISKVATCLALFVVRGLFTLVISTAAISVEAAISRVARVSLFVRSLRLRLPGLLDRLFQLGFVNSLRSAVPASDSTCRFVTAVLRVCSVPSSATFKTAIAG